MADYQAIRRIVMAGLIVVVAAMLVFGNSLQPAAGQERTRMAGMVLIMAGIVGRLWSILYIGGRKSMEVVQTGPYSVTRNPLYVFSTVAAAGVGAQAGSIVAAVLVALVCTAAFLVVARFEERYLIEQLGETYRDYMRRVPRFLPNPALYRDHGPVTFDPHVLLRTLRDSLLFLAAVPFFALIEAAQRAGLVPVLFRLW